MSQEDKISKMLSSDPNATKEGTKIKVKSEIWFIEYNPETKRVRIGTTTLHGHYAYITITPSYVRIRTKIAEHDYFKVTIRKPINMARIVYGIEKEFKTVDEALKEQGIEIDT